MIKIRVIKIYRIKKREEQNMFLNKYPIFKKGHNVDKEVFEILRDNPLEILSLTYSKYQDGIISGFELTTNIEEKIVIVNKGIIKCNGEIYWMAEDYKFDMPMEEDRYTLKLKLNSNIKQEKYFVREGEFILEKGYDNVSDDEIEITRFITRVGAELRNDYNNFADLRRDFNLLEIINTKYSSNHINGTLHPTILKLWGMEAAKKEELDIYDVNFYVNCLQGDVEREVIIAYINRKLDLSNIDYTNEELYENLLRILQILGRERRIIEKKRIIPQKITIE